jgi:hypothetical protein
LILQIHCKNLKTKQILCLGPCVLQKDPKKNWELAFWPLAGKQGRGGMGRPAPASYAHRRRGGWGGGAREDRALPDGGLLGARGGREGRRRGAVGHGGGGSRRWGCSGDRGWPASGRGASLARGGARGRISSGREREEQGLRVELRARAAMAGRRSSGRRCGEAGRWGSR